MQCGVVAYVSDSITGRVCHGAAAQGLQEETHEEDKGSEKGRSCCVGAKRATDNKGERERLLSLHVHTIARHMHTHIHTHTHQAGPRP